MLHRIGYIDNEAVMVSGDSRHSVMTDPRVTGTEHVEEGR